MESRTLCSISSVETMKISGKNHTAILIILLAGGLLPPLDFFIVNVGIPSIKQSLHLSVSEAQLVIAGYAAPYAIFVITGGRLGDIFGRKRVFISGLLLFTLSSVGCALSIDGNAIIIARIIQGISAASLGPQVIAIIRMVFPAERQGVIMGLYGMIFGLSSIIGQFGGALLIDWNIWNLGWRTIFLVNLPIGLLALLFASYLLPNDRPEKRTNRGVVDVFGIILLSFSLFLFIVPMIEGPSYNWKWPVFLAFAIGSLFFKWFHFYEQELKKCGRFPLVDFDLFTNRKYSLVLLTGYLYYFCSILFFAFPIYLEKGLKISVLSTGLSIVPYGIGYFICPILLNLFVKNQGRQMLAVGMLVYITGFIMLIISLSQRSDIGLLFHIGLLVAGGGQGISNPAIIRISLSYVNQENVGLASGLVSAVLQLGATSGIAILGTLFFILLGSAPSIVDYQFSFGLVLGLVAVLCVFNFCIGLWLIKAKTS
jgi:MFS family permease